MHFESLQISDVDDYLAISEEIVFTETTPKLPYKYSNNLAISEIFLVIERKLGKELHADELLEIKNAFINIGYTNAEVIRNAQRNQGSWEFIYRDFKHIGTYAVEVLHILTKILSKIVN